MGVTELGWTEERAAPFGPWAEEGLVPGRVVKQARDLAVVVTDERAKCRRRCPAGSVALRWTREASLLSATGVAVRLVGEGRAVIEAVLPRHGVFARKASRGVAEDLGGAHVDVVVVDARTWPSGGSFLSLHLCREGGADRPAP